MTHVVAIQSFDHDGPRRRGDEFEVSPQVAAQLRRAGLVYVDDEGVTANPCKVVGAKSSASPAAPALPKQTAKRSGGGGRAPKGAA